MCFFRRKKENQIINFINYIGGKENIIKIDIFENKAKILINDKSKIDKENLKKLSQGIMIQSNELVLFLDKTRLNKLKTFSKGGK